MSVPIEDRARNYLAKMPPGVSGSNRHAATFHAAVVLLHGFGLTQEHVDSWRFLDLLYYRNREKVLIFLNDYSQGESVWPNDLALPKEGPNGVLFLAQPVDGRYYPNPRSPGKDGKLAAKGGRYVR